MLSIYPLYDPAAEIILVVVPFMHSHAGPWERMKTCAEHLFYNSAEYTDRKVSGGRDVLLDGFFDGGGLNVEVGRGPLGPTVFDEDELGRGVFDAEAFGGGAGDGARFDHFDEVDFRVVVRGLGDEVRDPPDGARGGRAGSAVLEQEQRRLCGGLDVRFQIFE